MKEIRILFIPNEALEKYEILENNRCLYPHLYFDPNWKIKRGIFLYKWKNNYVRKKWKFRYFSFKIKSKLINLFYYIVKGIRIVKKFDLNVIRAYNPHIEWLAANIIGKLTKTKVVISVHNDFEYERNNIKKWKIFNLLTRLLENINYRLADKIIVVSSYLKDNLINRGIDSKKIEVIFNSFNISDYKVNYSYIEELKMKYNIKDDTFIFINIWRLVEQKNHFNLIRAFAKLINKFPERDIRLFIIWDWYFKEKLQAMINSYKLGNRIRLLWLIRNDLIINYLKVSKVFIFPSLYEGFWKVLVEAQIAWLPIISSDLPSVKDIIDSKNSILIKDPNNVEEIFQKMEYIINNYDIIYKFNRNYNLNKFDYNVLAEKEYNLYMDLLDR